jgi:hypothetical protein
MQYTQREGKWKIAPDRHVGHDVPWPHKSVSPDGAEGAYLGISERIDVEIFVYFIEAMRPEGRSGLAPGTNCPACVRFWQIRSARGFPCRDSAAAASEQF